MSDDALAALTLTELAAAIATKKVSSLEATRNCVERLERYGPVLNSVAALDAEAALDAAAAADAALAAGRASGPMHGVPLAHKDMYYRAGRPSACGSKILADFVPDVTSTALARLDRAGALDIARLNMVEFALGTTGHNEITGAVRNPWNPAHVTGGSSSGPGAAVAARLVYGALGSDTGGSIRLPAAACGLVGVKPTFGRVSRHGAMPLSFTLDTVGPLARGVADAALILQTIAGPDPNDPTTGSEPVPDYLSDLEAGVRGLRIATPENYFYDPVDAEVAALARASLEVFAALGAEIVPVEMPASIELGNPLTMLILAVEGAAFHGRWLEQRRADYGRQTLGRLLPGLLYPAKRYVEALNLRRKFVDELRQAVFERADVLHTPVWPFPLPTIEESDLAANPGFTEFIAATGHCSRPVNYAGLPGVSVPAGFTANGLPSAFQLVGRPFDEALLL
ncbi:MAG: amidase, partial [Proteobacteria bacterium]|nr:amidase [Pseudomonadota bacterium]